MRWRRCGVVLVVGALLSLVFRGPGDMLAIWLSAVVAHRRPARRLSPRACRPDPDNVMARMGTGALLRLLPFVVYAFLAAKVFELPLVAALVSLAAVFLSVDVDRTFVDQIMKLRFVLSMLVAWLRPRFPRRSMRAPGTAAAAQRTRGGARDLRTSSCRTSRTREHIELPVLRRDRRMGLRSTRLPRTTSRSPATRSTSARRSTSSSC